MSRMCRFLLSLTAICLGLWASCQQSRSQEGQTESRTWTTDFKYGRFQLHADFEITEVSKLCKQFAALAAQIEKTLALPPADEMVHIVIFESEREYRRYMASYFPSVPSRPAVYLQDRGPGMLFSYWHDTVETDLRHEITHAVLNAGNRKLPLWLDEGLAEYYEVNPEERLKRNDYLKIVAERAGQGYLPSIAQLERVQRLADFSDSHYRDSWAWVHFLLHRSPQTRKLLIQYLADKNRDPRWLLSRQLHTIAEDSSSQFAQHFQSLAASPAS